jgi:hypothetical protein
MNKNERLPTGPLLAQIKRRFYDPYPYPRRYYKDERMLLYTVTWPAAWLDRRALPIAAPDYQALLTRRLDDIASHGDPKRFRSHFPTYLLKTIQDWFAHHGDELYEKLKHVRNQLHDIETLLARNTPGSPEDIVTPMARAHAVLAARYRRGPEKQTQQLDLF